MLSICWYIIINLKIFKYITYLKNSDIVPKGSDNKMVQMRVFSKKKYIYIYSFQNLKNNQIFIFLIIKIVQQNSLAYLLSLSFLQIYN